MPTSHHAVPRRATTPARGRPRSEKARAAILAAAADLVLEQGVARVSMDGVAERAGVSKATIYRWWPSKELLALDALLEWTTAGVREADTGSLRGDLLAIIRPWVSEVRKRPFGGVIAAMIAKAHSDAEFADAYHARFVEPRRELTRTAFERAVARGEAPGQLDVDLALDLLYGPIYHRLLHGHAPLTDRFARDVVDSVVATVATKQNV